MTCILNITLTSKCYHAVQRNTCWSTSENKLQPVSHRPHSSCIQQLTLRILTAGTLKYDPPKVPLHAGGIWTPHPWALCPHKFTSEMASQLVQPCSTAHAHDQHTDTHIPHRPCYNGNNRPYLMLCIAMRPNYALSLLTV